MFTHAKAASYPRTAALVCSLTNLLSEPDLAQLSAEDSGRYSSPKQKLVFTCRPAACLALAYLGRIRTP